MFSVTRQSGDGWEFSDNILRKANGEIWWFTVKPVGVLIKYPCGTKRFINGLFNLPG